MNGNRLNNVFGFFKVFSSKIMAFGNQIKFQDFAQKIAEYFNIKSGIWLSFILNFLFPHYILYFCSCLASCAEFLCSLSHAAKCLLQQLSAFCFQPLPSNQPACKKTCRLAFSPIFLFLFLLGLVPVRGFLLHGKFASLLEVWHCENCTSRSKD